MDDKDSLEVRIARIDMNVQHLRDTLTPMVAKVEKIDRDLLIGKVVLAVGFVVLAYKFPSIADALGKLFGA